MEYKRIVNGILRNNTYLIIEDSSCIIIDPSTDFELIDSFLQGLIPKAIILTHGHHDHIASCDYFAKKYNIDIYVHEKAYDFLYSSKLNLSHNSNFSQEFVLKTKARTFTTELKIENFDFTVILTPGHTSGCCSFIVENYLLTGDFLFKGTIGRTDFITSDFKEMEKSLKKLKNLSAELIILPGHGEISTLKAELVSNPFLN